MKRKIKWLPLIIAGLFLLSACSASETNQPVESVPPEIEEETEHGSEETDEIGESEFYTRATELVAEAVELTSILSSVSVAQLVFWGELEESDQVADSELLVQHGFEWLETHSGITQNRVQADFNQLFAEYEALQTILLSSEEAVEIQSELSVLFAHFLMVYQAVTEPGDSFNDFILNMSTGIGGVIETNERLEALLLD